MEQKQIDQLDKLTQRLENCGLAEYVRLSQNMSKILVLNFLSGAMRGLGFTVGTAIVLAIACKIASELISMNIPYLTELLKELLAMLKTAP
jgi:hypothetical protein